MASNRIWFSEESKVRINILTNLISKATGGAIYDEVLYSKIFNECGNSVNCIVDAEFREEYKDVPVDFIRFALIYRKHSKEVLDCDYLITNSRLYTRFILFPWRIQRQRPRIIMIHHHYNYMTENGIKRRIHQRLEIAHLKRADIIITPNIYAAELGKQYGFDCKTMILESTNINNQVQKINRSTSKNFLFVGNVIERKGVNYAIEAFSLFYKDHPDYKLIIIGSYDSEPNYKRFLDELIARLQLKEAVVFRGRVTDEEKEEGYIQSRAFIFPSQNEGYGWVMVEAMKHGLPVVAFNNTAMPYTVNESNGFIVDNRDVAKMADAMRVLADDDIIYRRLQEGALKTVTSLPDEDEINKQYDEFLKIFGI